LLKKGSERRIGSVEEAELYPYPEHI